MGGSGTLYEAVNAVVGMPNMQISAYPYGEENCFLRYFGRENVFLFSSIRTQVFSPTVPIDAFRYGHHYGINAGIIGMEAYTNKLGNELFEKRPVLPNDWIYIGVSFSLFMRNRIISQRYKVQVDGMTLDGDYISMMVANSSCYGKNMSPASDAHPNDGLLDFYFIREMSRINYAFVAARYLSGKYYKLKDKVTHYRGKTATISSEHPMCIGVDSQVFYSKSMDFEVLPYAVDFVCPSGIDVYSVVNKYERKN
jgi:diacylglycerol kinase family enzyme